MTHHHNRRNASAARLVASCRGGGSGARSEGGFGQGAPSLRLIGLLVLAVAALLALTAGSSAYAACPNEQLRHENNSTNLPDCRAYEQVSPLDKGGFAATPETSAPAQNSPNGERIAYQGYSSFPGAQGNTGLFAEHLSTRTPSGWQTSEWTPPVLNPDAGALRTFLAGYAFSEDLTQAVIRVPNDLLTSGATPHAWNLFLRHPDGTYGLVNNAPPKLTPEEICGPGLNWLCWQIFDISSFAGATPDLGHILFESSAQLTEEAPETGTESLYENSGGQVSLVGYLPDGHPTSTSTAGAGSSASYFGEREADRRVEHAISADGSRVIFSAPSDEGSLPAETGQAALTEVYDRINGAETIELSAPNAGATPENPAAAPAAFWAASKDGSRVFFTSAAELTTASKTGDEGGEDLYEYDFAKPAGQRLTDLTPEAGPHGARVLGVVDASAEDGSYVYFVAKGQLDGAEGTEGQPNLYMSHAGESPVFIATLSASGSCIAGVTPDSCNWSALPSLLTSYVTPDGRHLAFMSTQSLPTVNFPSGYDNTDQKSGEADSEVYEWSAEGGELLCASCDPSGEPPLGPALIGGISLSETSDLGASTPFYRIPSLSKNGARLFYSSPAPDAGASYRVFEYEQPGEGSCAAVAGCQYPISSLSGKASDQFLGASADGEDVFFATPSRLIPGDEDRLIDVYDAREHGGFPVPPLQPPCEAEGCPGPGSASPPRSATGTETFAGSEEGPKHPTCARGQVKRHGRCVNKHHKPKKHRSHRRHANANRGGSK